MGSSPICCDCDFTIGSVRTRDGLKGVYSLQGNCLGCVTSAGASIVDPGSMNEVVWTDPSNVTVNMPGTYASVTLQNCGGGGGGGGTPLPPPAVYGGSFTGGIVFGPGVSTSFVTSAVGPDFSDALSNLVVATPTVILIPCFAFDLSTGTARYPSSVTDNRGNTYTPITSPLVATFGESVGDNFFGFIVYALILPSGVDLGMGDYTVTLVWESAANLEIEGQYPIACLNCSGIDVVTSNTVDVTAGIMTVPSITIANTDVIVTIWDGACCSGSYVRLTGSAQVLVDQAGVGAVVLSDGINTHGLPLLKTPGTYGGTFPLPGPHGHTTFFNGVTVAMDTTTGGGGGGGTCDTSQELVASNFMCVSEPPEGSFVLGTQIFVNGKQSTLDPSSVIKVTLSALGVVLATETFQLPLTDGTITLGEPTDTLGLTLAALESGTLEVMIQASSAVLATFDISGITIRVCFSVPGCDFDWIGTFEQQDSDLLTLALDSCGVFWQEDVINDPNVLVPFYPNILPNTFAVGVTEDDREFIALSNLQSGTDMPRQYDGTNLDRISQVGPGAPPQVTFGSNEYPIVSITQDMMFTHTQIRSVLWSSGPTQTHTPGNVLTFYFQIGTDLSEIMVGSGIVAAGFVTSLAGINTGSNPPYIVTSVGTAVGAGGTYPIITVIAPSVNNVDATPSAGTLQLTLATLTTSIPVPNLQVGNQMNVAGVTPATWDGTWTVLFTPNASQLSINTTSLTGNVGTYAYTIITGVAPTVGQLVTVTGTTNGNGIFNVSGVAITSVGASTFSVQIVSPDIAAEAEAGSAIVNGTIFQFDPGMIIPDGTGGFVVVAGGLGAGTRGAVVMFLTRNGYLTEPSPPVIFTLNEAASSIIVSQLPIGPPDTIARVVAFTGAGGATQSGGGGFYYWIPVPVTILDNGQTVTYNATIVNDNTTTTATFTFTDAVLLAAASISFQGSNNFAQIELGPSIGVIAYASRLFAWGVNNKVNNLLNFSFDGGIGTIIPPPGDSSTALRTIPLGWSLGPSTVESDGGSVVPSPLFGDSYLITNTSGMTQPTYGLILQSAYQDSNQVPIIASHTTYSIRVTASSTSTNGNLFVDLLSLSFKTVVGSFSIPLSSMTAKMKIFTGTLLTVPFQIVPNDLQIRVYADSLPNNASVLVDRIEVFPTEQPVLTTEVLASYFNNFEAFDEITGVVGVGTQNQQPVRSCFSLFDNLYIVKTNSMYVTSDNGVTEPDGWTVREVSNKVGTPSIYGVDYGQGWALIFGQAGLFVFDGGQPVPIAPEIYPLIKTINWKYGNTVWIKNDTTERKIYIGIPIATPNQWMPRFPVNANPSVPNVVLMCQYKELNTSGALQYEGAIRQSYMGDLRTYQLGRKWSAWSIEAHYGDFIKRPDTTTPLFLCADDGSGRINTQIEGLHEDNNNGIPLGLYCTYPFVKSQEAQALQLGMHNLRAQYSSAFIEGAGSYDMTIIPDSLQSPYANKIASIALGNPPVWGDTEMPLNDFGSRFFVQFAPHSAGDWWELSRFILDVTKDAWAPVRGGNY